MDERSGGRPGTGTDVGDGPDRARGAWRPLWVGTYPVAGADAPAGAGEGIWHVRLDPRTGALEGEQVVTSPAPSFLAVHPTGTVLYAAGEQSDGTVSAFAIRGDRLEHRATVSSGGASPCHLLLADDARTLYVANYTSGTLGVLPLDTDGLPTAAASGEGGPAQVFDHTGSGPRTDRQESPHAHFVALAPGGTHLLVVDLGTDELRRYRVGADGLLTADGVAAHLPPGTGPRHLAFSRDGRHVYVVGELDVALHVLAWDAARAEGAGVQVVPLAPGHTGARAALPSHVVLDGDRLLVGVREADVLVELAVRPDGLVETVPDGTTPLPGRWPRHLEVVDGWTVVAEQVSGDLATLPAGRGGAAHVMALPSPACVVAQPGG
ncbi:lactonase family protein [Cellulomonas sp. P22]|uniref:lactonase family protein n=1 Tax=Cellulomonas sp. P22 TaxID=3373189 RepID=UPI00379A43A6